jgi:hypothetical protein
MRIAVVDVTVDQNDFGDFIGVEVLGAQAQLGAAKLGSEVVNDSPALVLRRRDGCFLCALGPRISVKTD